METHKLGIIKQSHRHTTRDQDIGEFQAAIVEHQENVK